MCIRDRYVPEQIDEVPYRTLTFARSVPPPVPEDTIHVPIKIADFAQRASAAMDELTSLLNDDETNELLKDRTEADVNVDDCIIEPVDKAVTRAIHEMQTRMQREAEAAPSQGVGCHVCALDIIFVSRFPSQKIF